MEHNLTLSEMLNRFIVLEDESGSTVGHAIDHDASVSVFWVSSEGPYFEYNFEDTIVRTAGHYFYATDKEGDEVRFRAYAIVNFDDELPPQS